jgi:hypothetical protein
MQSIKLDVTKIDKSAIYEGKKGKYITLTLLENREGRDDYGNDGFVTQDIGKERRESGEKGPIVGNWKHLETKRPVQKSMPPSPGPVVDDDPDDDIPF